MSLWITETQPKNKTSIRQSLATWFNQLINKILESLKSKSVQSTYMYKLQKNVIDLNGFRTTIEITSIYRSLFKIHLSLQIVFMIHLQISVKYQVTPIDFSIVQKIPLMENLNYLLREVQKNPYRNIVIRLQNSIQVEQIVNHQFDPSHINIYAQFTSKYLTQTYHLCEAMMEDLKIEFWNSKCSSEKQKISNFFKAYKGLAMVEKENENFRKFYKNQNNGISFLANPSQIRQKPNQILRELQFQSDSKKKQVKINSSQKEKLKGGLSNISRIQIYGTIIDTYFNHRLWNNNQQQDPDYRPQNDGTEEGKFNLIRKTTCNNEDSINSMINEKNYLKLKGGLKIAYICSYFILTKKIYREPQKTKGKSSKNKQNCEQKQQKELYSQYHDERTFDKFHKGRGFTLLDIVNFGEQVMKGLIEFYLNLGYLHRDMKQENVLLNRKGVIQIIDHGSVYPYKRQIVNQLIEEQKKLFDSKLRSTICCYKEMFYDDPYLIGKYKHYKTYRDINSTHVTFDVYSVGIILDDLLTTYESFKYPKWMEVSQRLRILAKKMSQRDFQLRVQMESALSQLKQIRKFIYETQKS